MIVRNLKSSREYELNMSQRDLAAILKVHSSTISGWETGKDTIPIRRLIDYSNLFNFSLDYLFGLTSFNAKYEKLDIDLNILSSNLKKIRIVNNLTQTEVAKKINTR